MPAPVINPKFIFPLCQELTKEQQDHVRERLGFVPDGTGVADYEELWRRYQNEEIDLAILKHDTGEIVAFVFFGFEQYPRTGRIDMAVLAAGSTGRIPGVSTIGKINEQLTALAREKGCDGISFRTTRPGMARFFLKEGFFVSELILRKGL